jgi:hypothetical protein
MQGKYLNEDVRKNNFLQVVYFTELERDLGKESSNTTFVTITRIFSSGTGSSPQFPLAGKCFHQVILLPLTMDLAFRAIKPSSSFFLDRRCPRGNCALDAVIKNPRIIDKLILCLHTPNGNLVAGVGFT